MSFHNKKHDHTKYFNLSARYHENRKSYAPKENIRNSYAKNEEHRIKKFEKENKIIRLRLDMLEKTLKKMKYKFTESKNQNLGLGRHK